MRLKVGVHVVESCILVLSDVQIQVAVRVVLRVQEQLHVTYVAIIKTAGVSIFDGLSLSLQINDDEAWFFQFRLQEQSIHTIYSVVVLFIEIHSSWCSVTNIPQKLKDFLLTG